MKKFPAFYGNRKFIAVYNGSPWSLSWARRIQSTISHIIFLISIVIISSHLRLVLGMASSLQVLVLKFCMHFSSLTCVLHSPNLTLYDFIIQIIIGKVYQLWISSLCSLLQPPTTSSLLGPNILLSTLFPNTLNTCSYHVSLYIKISSKYMCSWSIMEPEFSLPCLQHLSTGTYRDPDESNP